ncbi:preprotein translocase subunit SecA [Oceanithermus sp.]
MLGLLKKLFDNNDREVQRYFRQVVDPTNALEEEVQKIDNLAAAYAEARQQHENGKSLDELLPWVFALARESARRYLGLRPYDVQLIGGAVLHEGRIAEMKTGEGKTLVATLPIALNALTGKGTHLVTVNDYLARRDAEWMRPVYHGLGLEVGVIQHDTPPPERRKAYLADITYVTNSELGFDYLRDNMSLSPEQLVLRHDHPLHYAIVDEVDSILIDEARTPLIISGPAEKATDLYYKMAEVARKLVRGEKPEPGEKDKEPTGDYTIDEKQRAVQLTEQGIARAEKLLGIPGLFSPENMEKAHMLIQAIRAKDLYHRDQDYIVQDGQVIIVDEFTGRLMPGRRFGEGLHQAIEAKEGVKIERENQTLATITYQNFFRQYDKTAGMTGTAKTEEKEFQEIYGMDVIVVPTNRPVIRQDHPDVVYRTEQGKFMSVVEEIAERYEKGQPVLVGTINIDKSERLSAMLREPRYYLPRVEMRANILKKAIQKQKGAEWEKLNKLLSRPANLREQNLAEYEDLVKPVGAAKDAWEELKRSVHTLEIIRKGIPHQVLNAKYHEKEAEIVAQAGRSGTITIATNMAGRGTDIKLGGNPEEIAKNLLEKQGLDRYEWKVELFVKKLIQGEEDEARKLAAEIEVPEETIEEIKKVRDEAKIDEQRVKELGGLAIIGTERHESRRIDNQLRGRSGRQGDPGESRFYVSFDDELMRLFASERVVAMLDRMGFDDSEPIEHKMVTGAIERAQKRVEDRNFGIRKQLLQFDDVMARQREVVYEQRRMVLLGKDEDVREAALAMVEDTIAGIAENYVNPEIHSDDWDLDGLKLALMDIAPGFEQFDFGSLRQMDAREALQKLVDEAVRLYEQREAELGSGAMRAVERFVILSIVDTAWKEHLHNLDVLRQGIGLRSYAQKDPFQEYKFEATRLFNEMIAHIKSESAKFFFRLKVETEPPKPQVYVPVPKKGETAKAKPEKQDKNKKRKQTKKKKKIGRNDPCWCGSGLKYKYCHGKNE